MRFELKPVLAFPALTVLLILLFFAYYLAVELPRAGSTEWITLKQSDTFFLSGRRYRLDRGDILPILLLTAVCAVVSFAFLGSHEAPESFYRFESDKAAVVELREETDVSSILYYPGLVTGSYTLEASADGVNWSEMYPTSGSASVAMEQRYSQLFKWQYAKSGYTEDIRFLRLSAGRNGMELGELALYGPDGSKMTAADIVSAPRELFDEQEKAPEKPTWSDSMIFDEIYHGRTAYEFLRNVYPYETTHPPLGKLIIAAGIAIFGMNPFGWRFMGTLFGVLLIPLLYIFQKQLFGKRAVAVCGTLLFVFDFMRYTQTRIATIDTYSVFFTLLMYLFMYRYMTEDCDAPLKKAVPSLFLSGLFFGIGAACKWTCIFAGAGLLILYVLYHTYIGVRYCRSGRSRAFAGRMAATLGLSVLFFLVIPAVIYWLAYIPYGLSRGMSVENGMLWSSDYAKIVLDNQKSMLFYHGELEATHNFQSKWYQWILDIRPILYYRDTARAGYKTYIAAFVNPMVCWGGLGAILALAYRTVNRKDGRALFLLVGYIAVLLPWLFITRCAFYY
ncbi:MAG: glycosyltransferase family 39 protein, partial [Oscillospiraceae bacterium]|nr:glycosyltransferase family 39 protein [Oscillospiraceae bacterium]